MPPPTGVLSRSSAVSTPSPRPRQEPVDEFLSLVSKLDSADVAHAKSQARVGGQVSPSDAELWGAYQGYLRTAQLKDTPGLRKEFLRQVVAREEFKQAKGLKTLDARQELSFRAGQALDALGARTDKRLTADDAWVVRALSHPALGFSPEQLTLMRGFSVEGSRAGNLEELIRPREVVSTKGQIPKSVGRTVSRQADSFERPVATTPTQRRVVQTPISDGPYSRAVANPAASPEDARAALLALVSSTPKDVAALESRRAVPTGDVIDARASREVREAYREFLASRRVPDGPATQREFVSLLSLRTAYMSRQGLSGSFSAADERAFLAETALSRLRTRAQTGQSLEPREGEGWMKQVLADPSVPLAAEDLKLLGQVRWTNMGLSTSLAELRSDATKVAQASKPPPPGAPYGVTLNADRVFDGGDVQRTAFTLAARAGGYKDEEIGRAMQYLREQGVKLYCKQNEPGEPLVLKREDAKSMAVGGQDFVEYSMSGAASMALRDARLAGPGVSVTEFRNRPDNSWSGKIAWLGEKLLAFEQAKDKALGLEQNSVLGPIMRGKYDAIRELTLIGSNAGQLAEMATTTARGAVQTGNLFYTIKGDEQQSLYFDSVVASSRAAFERTGRTYSAEEQSFAANFARGLVGGAPKMAVSMVPGAVIFYNALKHTNNDFSSFGKETFVDLLGSLAGPAGGRLASVLKSGAGRALPSLVDNAVASRVVNEVMDRGSSGVVGATSNVATELGPLVVQNALGQADPEEVKKRLTTEAFLRNVGTGFALGLLTPERYAADDNVVLSRRDTSLTGPLYGVPQSSGELKYYAAASVGKTADGKPRFEFLEVSPTHPKVRQKLKDNEVTQTTQAEVDGALMQSRWDNRLSSQGRQDLKAQANRYAEKTTLADAERGVLLLEAPQETIKPATAQVSPTTAQVPDAPQVDVPVKASRQEGPIEPGVPPEKLSAAQAKADEAVSVWRESDADEADDVLTRELLRSADEVGVAPEVRQKLAALDDFTLRGLMVPPRAETYRVLSSKDPAVISHVKDLLGSYGDGALDKDAVRGKLQELAQKGPPSNTPRPLSSVEQRLDTLLAKSPSPKGAGTPPSTPLPQGAVNLSQYRSDAATRSKMVETLGSSLSKLQEEVRDVKKRHPELAKIPDEDLLSLRAYSSELPKVGYGATNAALRTQDTEALTRLAPIIQGASSALNQLPSYQGKVFRGIRSADIPPDVLAQYVPGKTVTERSFLSSSKEEKVARDFSQSDVLMVIQSRGRGRDMASTSRSAAESEVLFTPGTRFRVLARETDATGKTVIYLDEEP